MSAMYPEVHARAHELAAALVAEVARPGEWVLDCGAGDLGLSAAMEARGLRVLAVDPKGGPGIARASWEALPVRPGSVAAITACASLHYARDPPAAVAGAADALRPGGRLIALLSPVHTTDEGARRGERTARKRTGNPVYRHFSAPEAERCFTSAGLSFEVRPFELKGSIGRKRRIKTAFGVDLAGFPTLIGAKPPV